VGRSVDFIAAIDVIERVADPSRLLTPLKPNGVLFLTTGNARPFRYRLPNGATPAARTFALNSSSTCLGLSLATDIWRPAGFSAAWQSSEELNSSRTWGNSEASLVCGDFRIAAGFADCCGRLKMSCDNRVDCSPFGRRPCP
jgi:hypothetical protein